MDLEALFDAEFAGITLEKLLWTAVLAIVLLAAVKLLLRALDRGLRRSRVDPTLQGVLRTLAKLLLLFVAALIVMGYLSIPVTSLVAVLSVVGLAVSLSVQSFLSNVVGGFQLLASHPFKVGDYVEAGGCEGTVQEIGMFYTKLLTMDNKLVQLPNSSVASATVTNYTAERLRRVDLTVKVSYDAPVEQVKRCLTAVIEQTPGTVQEPAPAVRVNAYGDSAIEYTVRAWCRHEDYWDVYFDLNEGLKAGLDKAGLPMTYGHLNVHLVGQ